MKESPLLQLVDRKTALCLLLGALVGTAAAVAAINPAFIAGTGGTWLRPDNDYAAYIVAWNYYVIDAWRFPLFDLPAMGYPEGGSILFNDALPIAALASKLVYRVSGVKINPFGWWVLLTYVLQGVMAARILLSVGVRSAWATVAAATFAVINTAFMSRTGHTALSSHFLLLWAMALHFESVRAGRAKIVEFSVLLALALLVNSYLFAMVFAFKIVTLVALSIRGRVTIRDWGYGAIGIAATIVLGIAAGYGVFLVNPTSMKGDGFGFFSWNPATLLLPPTGIFGFFANVPRNATGGQYEGEAYVGVGALLFFVLAIAFAPRKTVEYLRRYWVYTAALGAFAVYAASNLVYFGSRLIVSYDLPDVVIGLCNYFRATGRFIWPLAYAVMILPAAVIFRTWHPAAAVAAALVAVLLQVQEARPGIERRHQLTTRTGEDLIDTPKMASWLEQHERLWQYPSWACGGLRSNRPWGSAASNQELQVQVAAARAGVPTNSVYTSRMLKNCPAEFRWPSNPQLEAGVLYLLNREVVEKSPALTALARSNACVTFDWAIICSQQWARLAAERREMPGSPPK